MAEDSDGVRAPSIPAELEGEVRASSASLPSGQQQAALALFTLTCAFACVRACVRDSLFCTLVLGLRRDQVLRGHVDDGMQVIHKMMRTLI